MRGLSPRPCFGFSGGSLILVETEGFPMTFTHLQDDERKANPRAAMVRVEIRDAQGYANQGSNAGEC